MKNRIIPQKIEPHIAEDYTTAIMAPYSSEQPGLEPTAITPYLENVKPDDRTYRYDICAKNGLGKKFAEKIRPFLEEISKYHKDNGTEAYFRIVTSTSKNPEERGLLEIDSYHTEYNNDTLLLEIGDRKIRDILKDTSADNIEINASDIEDIIRQFETYYRETIGTNILNTKGSKKRDLKSEYIAREYLGKETGKYFKDSETDTGEILEAIIDKYIEKEDAGIKPILDEKDWVLGALEYAKEEIKEDKTSLSEFLHHYQSKLLSGLLEVYGLELENNAYIHDTESKTAQEHAEIHRDRILISHVFNDDIKVNARTHRKAYEENYILEGISPLLILARIEKEKSNKKISSA